jgi:nicotinamidase-related amidase
MKEAFSIVDIQNDFFEGEKMALKGANKASENARNALQYFREKRIPVNHVRHIDVQNQLHFFKPNTFGAEILSD